jgi:hypothetical protein
VVRGDKPMKILPAVAQPLPGQTRHPLTPAGPKRSARSPGGSVVSNRASAGFRRCRRAHVAHDERVEAAPDGAFAVCGEKGNGVLVATFGAIAKSRRPFGGVRRKVKATTDYNCFYTRLGVFGCLQPSVKYKEP